MTNPLELLFSLEKWTVLTTDGNLAYISCSCWGVDDECKNIIFTGLGAGTPPADVLIASLPINLVAEIWSDDLPILPSSSIGYMCNNFVSRNGFVVTFKDDSEIRIRSQYFIRNKETFIFYGIVYPTRLDDTTSWEELLDQTKIDDAMRFPIGEIPIENVFKIVSIDFQQQVAEIINLIQSNSN